MGNSIQSVLSPEGRLSYLQNKRSHPDPDLAPPDYLSWSGVNRAMLGPDRPFDLKTRPYLRDIYADDVREMVIQKAAQRGASEYLIGWVLWSADVKKANALYVFPTDRHVSEFSAARLGPAIEASPYLQKLIVSGQERGADRVTFKRVRDRFLYFRGGKIEPDGRSPQLKSIDADVLVLDELDELDPRVEPIARKRLEASHVAQIRIVSTPTFEGVGINAAYLASDQRSWHLKCRACNQWQSISLKNLVIEWDELERPVLWFENEGEPFLGCIHCGKPLDRLGQAEWVAEFPDRPVHGYHIHGLYSTQKPLRELITSLRELNETKRQQTFNQELGLTYTSRHSSRINRSVLEACRREYSLGGTSTSGVYAGIDVGTVLHIAIRDGARERKALYLGTVQSFEEAARLCKQFGVKTCVIDALPETRKAREFAALVGREKVWLSYYQEGAGTGVAGREAYMKWNEDERTVHVDRTQSLDTLYALFYAGAEQSSTDNTNTLPMDITKVPDYIDQVRAPIRKLVPSSAGNERAVYSEGGDPDHYAHAENYCAIAHNCTVGGTWVGGTKRPEMNQRMDPRTAMRTGLR